MQQNTTYLHLHFIANKHQHHRLEAVGFWFPIPSSVGMAVDVEQLDWDGKKFKKKSWIQAGSPLERQAMSYAC